MILYPSDGFRINVANRAGHAEVEVTRADRENSHIIAKITEVLPQHVYTVSAKQTLKVGNRVHPIELTGKIREQDIGPDDSASSDLLFDSNLQVTSDVATLPPLIKPKGPKITKPNDQSGTEVTENETSEPVKIPDENKDIPNTDKVTP